MNKHNPKNHISFSELMNWVLCPAYHKLVNIDNKLPFKGSEFTCLGTAAHHVIEELSKAKAADPNFKYDHEWAVLEFDKVFKAELKKFWDDVKEHDSEYKRNVELVKDLRKSGHRITGEALPALKRYLGEYEFVATEHLLYVPFKDVYGHEYSFKGYIDLVVKTPDDVVHLIDWKTCSWGWDSRKKSSISKVYQLVYYKHFYAKEMGLDPEKIKCHFGLLKRTPSKKDSSVEIFEVPMGKRRIKNALTLLESALKSIHRGVFIHNWNGCKSKDRYGTCPFINTEHCMKRDQNA